MHVYKSLPSTETKQRDRCLKMYIYGKDQFTMPIALLEVYVNLDFYQHECMRAIISLHPSQN